MECQHVRRLQKGGTPLLCALDLGCNQCGGIRTLLSSGKTADSLFKSKPQTINKWMKNGEEAGMEA